MSMEMVLLVLANIAVSVWGLFRFITKRESKFLITSYIFLVAVVVSDKLGFLEAFEYVWFGIFMFMVMQDRFIPGLKFFFRKEKIRREVSAPIMECVPLNEWHDVHTWATNVRAQYGLTTKRFVSEYLLFTDPIENYMASQYLLPSYSMYESIPLNDETSFGYNLFVRLTRLKKNFVAAPSIASIFEIVEDKIWMNNHILIERFKILRARVDHKHGVVIEVNPYFTSRDQVFEFLHKELKIPENFVITLEIVEELTKHNPGIVVFPETRSFGTGFCINDTLAITAKHVLKTPNDFTQVYWGLDFDRVCGKYLLKDVFENNCMKVGTWNRRLFHPDEHVDVTFLNIEQMFLATPSRDSRLNRKPSFSKMNVLPVQGTKVYKNGVATGITYGTIVHFEDISSFVVETSVSCPFAIYGDSGALVCDENDVVLGIISGASWSMDVRPETRGKFVRVQSIVSFWDHLENMRKTYKSRNFNLI